MGYNLRVELQKCLKALFKKDSWTVKTHFSCKTSDLYFSGNLKVVYYFYPRSDQTILLDDVKEAKDAGKYMRACGANE